MADLNFDTTNETRTSVTPVDETETTEQIPENPVQAPEHNHGLSLEELNDANKIKVTIADYKTPLVILFGAPACGKTMTLIRLTRYLQSKGYTVQPETSFRPAYDKNYKEMCENFDTMINSEDAAQSTDSASDAQRKTFVSDFGRTGGILFPSWCPAGTFPQICECYHQ